MGTVTNINRVKELEDQLKEARTDKLLAMAMLIKLTTIAPDELQEAQESIKSFLFDMQNNS